MGRKWGIYRCVTTNPRQSHGPFFKCVDTKFIILSFLCVPI